MEGHTTTQVSKDVISSSSKQFKDTVDVCRQLGLGRKHSQDPYLATNVKRNRQMMSVQFARDLLKL